MAAAAEVGAKVVTDEEAVTVPGDEDEERGEGEEADPEDQGDG